MLKLQDLDELQMNLCYSNQPLNFRLSWLLLAGPWPQQEQWETACPEWEDTRQVHLDNSVMMSMSYDWTGWDCREELHAVNGSFAVWRHSGAWAAYGGPDGYFDTFHTQAKAKAAAEQWAGVTI